MARSAVIPQPHFGFLVIGKYETANAKPIKHYFAFAKDESEAIALVKQSLDEEMPNEELPFEYTVKMTYCLGDRAFTVSDDLSMCVFAL